MNTLNKKALCVALAAFGAAGAAQAVNVSSDGLGQVLLYPYYTVRNDPLNNAYNTLISVVNTTASAKAVKVRFIEGKNSYEVLDFNLYLSAKDVWTAAVVPTATGARILVGESAPGVKDTSCTLPNVVDGKEFVNFAYAGPDGDKGEQGLDRTREGYIEIIEMGTIAAGSTLEEAVTHVAGVPDDCSYVKNSTAGANAQGRQVLGIRGGLFGSAQLINVASGTLFDVDPTVLDNFATGRSLIEDSGSVQPNLTRAFPAQSTVIDSANQVIRSSWSAGTADPVSAVLMHDKVLNEYVDKSGLAALTDWVVTFPTKQQYIEVGPGNNTGILFQKNFNTTVGSCDDVTVTLYDREEREIAEVDFSPPPPGGNALCWEANVITFNKGNLLGSVNTANVETPYGSGWASLNIEVEGDKHYLINDLTRINGVGPAPDGSGFYRVVYFGLPMIGFSATSYTNGTLPSSVLSNYGGSSKHKATKSYSVSLPPTP